MTLEPVHSRLFLLKFMNPEKQRIAIAEACGWKVHPKDRFIVIPPNSPNSVQPLYTLPDYLNDLNALHEAEKTLKVKIEYYEHLRDVCGRDSVGSAFTATAPQRAEAFLKTLNLWKNNN